MSLFDTDIIERTMYVRHAYDINIASFNPDLFYKWIWAEKGIDYPPRYPKLEGIPKQLLYDILVDKLGEIPADDFIKWEEVFVKKRSIKYFRRYFKKLIKREYMPNFDVNFDEKDIQVCVSYVPHGGFFNESIQMTIKFHRK